MAAPTGPPLPHLWEEQTKGTAGRPPRGQRRPIRSKRASTSQEYEEITHHANAGANESAQKVNEDSADMAEAKRVR